MASTANQLRLQARRVMLAAKKATKGHAKPKQFKGPAPRRLKIRG